MKKKLFLILITLLSTVSSYSIGDYEKDGVRYTIMTNYSSRINSEYIAIASAKPDEGPTGDLVILETVGGKKNDGTTITAPVTTVNNFGRCYGLTSVIIPNTVLELGAYCFQNDSNLVKVQLSNNII